MEATAMPTRRGESSAAQRVAATSPQFYRDGSPSVRQHPRLSPSNDEGISNNALLGSLANYLPIAALTPAFSSSVAAAQNVEVPPLCTSSSTGGRHECSYRGSADAAVSTSLLRNSDTAISNRTSGVPHVALERAGLPPAASRTPVDSRRRSDEGSGRLSGNRQSNQSMIRVLSITRNGESAEMEQPGLRVPEAAAAALHNGGSALTEQRRTPPLPSRRASLNRVPSGGATSRVVAGKVQLETIPPITRSSLSTASSEPSAVAEDPQLLRQVCDMPPRQSGSAPMPPRHNSVPSSTRVASRPASAMVQALPYQRNPPMHRGAPAGAGPTEPPFTPSSFLLAASTGSTPRKEVLRRRSPTNASESHRSGECSPGLSTTQDHPRDSLSNQQPMVLTARHHHDHNRSSYPCYSSNGSHDAAAVLQPSYQRGKVSDMTRPPRPPAPVTLQISTTTLTKATKKVRYLLPGEPFDPDAPDPADSGGITAAEETALLYPVHYSQAVEDVVGQYPALLRRSSARGGDFLHSNGSSASAGSPVAHPTFLLDDGNRWARETNRPAAATTRDPSGTTRVLLPAPSCRQTTGSAASTTATDQRPFQAPLLCVEEDGSDDGSLVAERGGAHLLQRHVQQMATGTRLVQGTSFQPPSSGAVSARRTRLTEELYKEILRCAEYHRRSVLLTAPPPSDAPPQALPPPAFLGLTPKNAPDDACRDCPDHPAVRPSPSLLRHSGVVSDGVTAAAPYRPHTPPCCALPSHGPGRLPETYGDVPNGTRRGNNGVCVMTRPAPPPSQQEYLPQRQGVGTAARDVHPLHPNRNVAGAAVLKTSLDSARSDLLHPRLARYAQPAFSTAEVAFYRGSTDRGNAELCDAQHSTAEPSRECNVDTQAPAPALQHPQLPLLDPAVLRTQASQATAAAAAAPISAAVAASQARYVGSASDTGETDRSCVSYITDEAEEQGKEEESAGATGNTAGLHSSFRHDAYAPSRRAGTGKKGTLPVPPSGCTHASPKLFSGEDGDSEHRAWGRQHVRVEPAQEDAPPHSSTVTHAGGVSSERMTRKAARTDMRVGSRFQPAPPPPSAVVARTSSSAVRQPAPSGAARPLPAGTQGAPQTASTSATGHAWSLTASSSPSPSPSLSRTPLEDCASSRNSVSCDTETQPVTVSERGAEDWNDDDDCFKKEVPPVLVLGDEVYAPAGYECVEEGEAEYLDAEAGEVDGSVEANDVDSRHTSEDEAQTARSR